MVFNDKYLRYREKMAGKKMPRKKWPREKKTEGKNYRIIKRPKNKKKPSLYS